MSDAGIQGMPGRMDSASLERCVHSVLQVMHAGHLYPMRRQRMWHVICQTTTAKVSQCCIVLVRPPSRQCSWRLKQTLGAR